MPDRILLACPAILVLSCLLFGGGLGARADMALELLSVVLLAVAVFRSRRNLESPSSSDLLVILSSCLLLALLHLLPLPHRLWAALPGRSWIAEGYQLLGISPPNLPISLDPRLGTLGALAIIPAIAVAVAIMSAGRKAIVGIAAVTLLVAATSVVVSVAQAAGIGGAGRSAFFNNDNHLATFLLMCIPLVPALLGEFRSRSGTATSTHVLIGSLMITFLSVGIFVVGSVAGLLILPIVLLPTVRLQFPHLPFRVWFKSIFVALTALGALATVVLSSPRALSLDTGLTEGNLDRVGIYKASLEVAETYWPVGAGIGAFQAAFQIQEDVQDVSNTYVNHAHSEYLQIAVEFGLAGLLIIIASIFFMLRWTIVVWRSDAFVWGRAASIALCVVAVHSLIDYPARTLAISVLACACLTILRLESFRASQTCDSSGI